MSKLKVGDEIEPPSQLIVEKIHGELADCIFFREDIKYKVTIPLSQLEKAPKNQ